MPRIFFFALLPLLLLGLPLKAEQAMHYTVQLASFGSLERAERGLDRLTETLPLAELPDLRLEQIGQLYAIRVGRFTDLAAAKQLLERVRPVFPHALQRKAFWDLERMVVVSEAAAADSSSAFHKNLPASSAQELPAPAPVTSTVAQQTLPVEDRVSSIAERTAVPSAQNPEKKREPASIAAIKPVPPLNAKLAGFDPQPDLQWWGLLAMAVLLGGTILTLLVRQNRSEEDNRPMPSANEHKAALPILPKAWELQLQKNQRELTAAEGNLLSAGESLKTFYLSSCFHGEGKTTAAINLAYGLAEVSNKRILLIDGNSHAPKLHELFGTELSPGLTDLYDDPQSITAVMRPTAYANLTLLTHGDSRTDLDHVPPQVALLQDPQLREQFDYILIDGDSTLGSSRVPLLAKNLDGILLAVACEKTKWEVVQQVQELITQVGGQVVGVLLNKRKYYIPRFLYGRK